MNRFSCVIVAVLGLAGVLRCAAAGTENTTSTVFVVSRADSMKDIFKPFVEQLKVKVDGMNAADGSQFGFIAFGGKATSSLKGGKLLRVTGENKTKAKAFLDGLSTGGTSDPVAALKQALKLKPTEIYFALDGLDSKLKPDDLVKAVPVDDSDQVPVKINCLYFQGDKPDDALKAALASITRSHLGTLIEINKSAMK